MTGVRLDGGMGGVLRVGDRVHRTTGSWTPAVHALLAHLDGRLPHVPRVHGFDGDGHEVLDFLPGEIEETLTTRQITALVSWTGAFHDAVADFVHPGPWRYFPVPEPSLIGHNDIAQYNACFDGDDLVGVFDWDMAGPTSPVMELAFTAWNVVPLWSDIGVDAAAERLTVIADAYGGPDPRRILHAVPPRIRLMLDGIPARAAEGDAGMRNLMGIGEPDRSRPNLEGLVSRLHLIDQAL